MSPFLERAHRWLRAGAGFRLRFLLAMMLVVAAITAAAVLVAQRHVRAAAQSDLEERFQNQTTTLLAMRATRLTAITDKCRALSHSVRIRAALEEADVEDLYRNALDELRNVIYPDDNPDDNARTAASVNPRALPHANFFGFIDANGLVLAPPASATVNGSGSAGLETFAQQFAHVEPERRKLDRQEIGYLMIQRPDGKAATLDEVIVTPIDDPGSDGHLGALVLGFAAEIPSTVSGAADRRMASAPIGIWLGGTIHGLTVPQARSEAALPQQLSEAVARSPRSDLFQVGLDGAPYLLFYQALEVGACFPPAYGVSLYPLGESVRAQNALRWRIIGWGAGALAVGFALSFLISGRLSAPVEQLAKGAVENLAGRRRAEAELLAANQQLERALTELKATQAQIIQQERLRALGEMASGIAHDFNNALMPILGFSELLLSLPHILDDQPKTIGYLQTINRGARDAGNVVRRLREFYRAREEGEEFLPVNLAQLVGQIADLTQPKWKDQALSHGTVVDFKTRVEAVPAVLGNESDLREALTNLVFNAVDAMPKGGTLTLSARQEGEFCVLEVTDSGLGMSEEVRRRCLEPFFSTKGDRGTGLGLSMVFGIMQRHRGTVEIDSREGEGSTFRLRLPRFVPASRARQNAREEAQAAKRALRILAVEDEPAVRDILVHLLESEGHRVVTADTARSALEQFHEQSFDLVITDMAMPGMSGDQLAATLKSLAPALPVVLLTGFGAFLDPERKMAGADVIASKPITLDGLRQCILAALHPEAAIA